MRAFMCYLAMCVIAHGISAVAVMRELPVTIGILCVLMHVVVACAFLLPVFSISWKGRIAGIVTVHLLAASYLEYASPWFDQRQIDEISHRVTELEGVAGQSDILTHEVEIAFVDVDIRRKRTLYPGVCPTGSGFRVAGVDARAGKVSKRD